MLALVVTGFLFWRPWFAHFFPIDVVRLGAPPACGRRGGADHHHHGPHLHGHLDRGVDPRDDAGLRDRALGEVPPRAVVPGSHEGPLLAKDGDRPEAPHARGDRRSRRLDDSVSPSGRPPGRSSRCAPRASRSLAAGPRHAGLPGVHREGGRPPAGDARRHAAPQVALPLPAAIEKVAMSTECRRIGFTMHARRRGLVRCAAAHVAQARRGDRRTRPRDREQAGGAPRSSSMRRRPASSSRA